MSKRISPTHISTHKQNTHRKKIISWLISSVLGLFIVYQITDMILSFRKRSIELIQHSPINIKNIQPIKVVSQITDTHLFGYYYKDFKNLPKSHLPIHLEGIVLSSSPSQTTQVLIALPTQATKLYTIGDTLPGNAIIRYVLQDQVIIENAGQLESLSLPIPDIQGTIVHVETEH